MVTLLLDAGSDPNIGHPKEGSPLLQVRCSLPWQGGPGAEGL